MTQAKATTIHRVTRDNIFYTADKANKEMATMQDLKAQTICPVMGGKVDKQYWTDHKGQRVYFCCPSCEKKFKEAPEKYIAKMLTKG